MEADEVNMLAFVVTGEVTEVGGADGLLGGVAGHIQLLSGFLLGGEREGFVCQPEGSHNAWIAENIALALKDHEKLHGRMSFDPKIAGNLGQYGRVAPSEKGADHAEAEGLLHGEVCITYARFDAVFVWHSSNMRQHYLCVNTYLHILCITMLFLLFFREHAPITLPMGTHLKTKKAAEWLGVDDSTLRDWRARHYGPPYIALSPRCFVYRMEDLIKWVADRHHVPSVRAAQETYANR
jgi:hypothetical protein